MDNQITIANNELMHFYGSEVIYKNETVSFTYTEGIKELVDKYECRWFLYVIESYQNSLKSEEMQVWKIERDLISIEVDGKKEVKERKISIKVTCEDGDYNTLITQHIDFSDFPFDLCTVWLQNQVLYLPSEH